MSDIDPVKFGMMVESIKNIETRLDNIEPKLESLVILKNKGVGYFAAVLTLSGITVAGLAEGVRRLFGGH